MLTNKTNKDNQNPAQPKNMSFLASLFKSKSEDEADAEAERDILLGHPPRNNNKFGSFTPSRR